MEKEVGLAFNDAQICRANKSNCLRKFNALWTENQQSLSIALLKNIKKCLTVPLTRGNPPEPVIRIYELVAHFCASVTDKASKPLTMRFIHEMIQFQELKMPVRAHISYFVLEMIKSLPKDAVVECAQNTSFLLTQILIRPQLHQMFIQEMLERCCDISPKIRQVFSLCTACALLSNSIVEKVRWRVYADFQKRMRALK
jgi:hypothetical protein